MYRAFLYRSWFVFYNSYFTAYTGKLFKTWARYIRWRTFQTGFEEQCLLVKFLGAQGFLSSHYFVLLSWKLETKLLSLVSTVLFALHRLCFPRACLPPLGEGLHRPALRTKRKRDKKTLSLWFIGFCTEELTLRAFISVLLETWTCLGGSVLVCIQFHVTLIIRSSRLFHGFEVRYGIASSFMKSGVFLMGLGFFFFSMCFLRKCICLC